MEQRIDSNTKPEFAAGTDPAYIPGLTAPAPARTEADAEAADAAPEDAGGHDDTDVQDTADIQDAVVEQPAGDRAAGPDDAVLSGTAVTDDDEGTAAVTGAAGTDEPGATGDGPVFEVSDRRGSIRVDAEGVRFRLDDQEAEFDWSEIGAVEVTTGRFGRRFTVTVHLSSRRWFNAEVEADARGRLKEWTAELDAALDAHFEEG
ncbi:hypothetical protein OG206_07475 [Streptomyces sp. NBC_01341]|uniref:hypothetical protein n=1 Tax=Streptomyces sp. NBC_01341 TaxID=2903831 RepID=UPI002E1670B5|nr:hypothetical protein OG206_07475 [Streptomyces sp. NBC_01341]